MLLRLLVATTVLLAVVCGQNFSSQQFIDTIVPGPTCVDAADLDAGWMLTFTFGPNDYLEAGRVTIAEVEEIVAPGEIDPHLVHTPGIYVDRVVIGENQDKVIERRKTRPVS